MTRLALLLAALALCSGCATKVHVTSDTYWEGSINGGTVEGYGNQTFEWVRQEGYRPCCYFKKETERGFLRVQVAQRWQEDSARETREPYGEVGVCVK